MVTDRDAMASMSYPYRCHGDFNQYGWLFYIYFFRQWAICSMAHLSYSKTSSLSAFMLFVNRVARLLDTVLC